MTEMLIKIVQSESFISFLLLVTIGIIISQLIAERILRRRPDIKAMTLCSLNSKTGFSLLKLETSSEKIHNMTNNIQSATLVADPSTNEVRLQLRFMNDDSCLTSTPLTFAATPDTVTITDCQGNVITLDVGA